VSPRFKASIHNLGGVISTFPPDNVKTLTVTAWRPANASYLGFERAKAYTTQAEGHFYRVNTGTFLTSFDRARSVVDILDSGR